MHDSSEIEEIINQLYKDGSIGKKDKEICDEMIRLIRPSTAEERAKEGVSKRVILDGEGKATTVYSGDRGIVIRIVGLP